MRREMAWRGVVAALLALAVVLPAPAAAQVGIPPAAIEAVERAVVQVNTIRDGGGRVVRGSGSGLIIDPGGLVLTAEHVVARSTRLEVVLRSGEMYPAVVVGADPVFDVALIRFEPPRLLPTLVLGSSSLLVTGDPVGAFGRAPRRPAGPTVGSFLALDVEARPGIPWLRSTAMAWPGDSGGALVNVRGEAVGLIVAISRDGTVSVAVAMDAIVALLADLRAGTVRHPWIGISGRTITEDLAARLRLPVRSGVLITEVFDGGPAALAGLRGGRAETPNDIPRGGDIITAVDGRPVSTFGQFAAYVLSRRIGDTVQLDLLRDGQPFSASAVLAPRPSL